MSLHYASIMHAVGCSVITALISRRSSLAKLSACRSLSQELWVRLPPRANFFLCSIGGRNGGMPGIQFCSRDRKLVRIGMIPEPSAEEDVQCSGTNTHL